MLKSRNLALLVGLTCAAGCGESRSDTPHESSPEPEAGASGSGGASASGASGGASGSGASSGASGGASSGASSGASGSGGASAGGTSTPIDPSVPRLVVSASNPTARQTSLSANYWMWPSAYADDVSGTEQAIAPLAPALLRMGGYNNDANLPMAFDDAELDRAVAYARAVGAEPLVQVPLLADVDGSKPTAMTAANMVTYTNVTQAYGIKYFSIGNEPDLYPTQGSLTSMSDPAIPGYTPADYCATARDFVSAMKAVDPSIQIVGPDLAWHYVNGNDWLTPILQTCGDLFDIVSFHRYPFSSDAATLEAAEPDAAAFVAVVDHVRGLVQAAGQGDKPLALTEMNVVYNATTCQQTASPRTTGSGLWLADAFGTAIEKQLFTTTVWDISDDDGFALGLLGPAPAHTPRPEYYAYALVSQHLGPTQIDVVEAPSHVHAYAMRNAKNDATELIAINWSTASVPLAVEVGGLAKPPAAAPFTLPALSVTTIEVPDSGAPQALTYGEAERNANGPPIALDAGLADATDAGPPVLDNPCPTSVMTCPQTTLTDANITTAGATSGSDLVFGQAPFLWHSFAYAASGQVNPVTTLGTDGKSFSVTGGFMPPLTGGNWEGVGFYLDNDHCADVASYTGIRFDFSGDLGDCTLAFGADFSGDATASDNPGRGTCPGSSDTCYPPMSAVSGTSSSQTTTVKIPFASLSGGSPLDRFDATTLITIEWQLNAPSSGQCQASFAIANVAFY